MLYPLTKVQASHMNGLIALNKNCQKLVTVLQKVI